MKFKLVTTLALLVFSVPVLAGGFEHYDKDANGYITPDELGEERAAKMREIDANGDQLISKEEFEAYKASKDKVESSE